MNWVIDLPSTALLTLVKSLFVALDEPKGAADVGLPISRLARKGDQEVLRRIEIFQPSQRENCGFVGAVIYFLFAWAAILTRPIGLKEERSGRGVLHVLYLIQESPLHLADCCKGMRASRQGLSERVTVGQAVINFLK